MGIQEVFTPSPLPFDLEHNTNYVLLPFMEGDMIKTFVHEAAALASLALFVSMIAIWTQVLGNL